MSSRRVRLTSAAERDLLETVDWFRKEAPHVISRFRQRFREGLQRIGSHPLQFPAVHDDVRRAQIHGFRHLIFFRLLPESIQILAVLHSSRDPRIWQRR